MAQNTWQVRIDSKVILSLEAEHLSDNGDNWTLYNNAGVPDGKYGIVALVCKGPGVSIHPSNDIPAPPGPPVSNTVTQPWQIMDGPTLSATVQAVALGVGQKPFILVDKAGTVLATVPARSGLIICQEEVVQ
jgi:hypothetical protein